MGEDTQLFHNVLCGKDGKKRALMIPDFMFESLALPRVLTRTRVHPACAVQQPHVYIQKLVEKEVEEEEEGEYILILLLLLQVRSSLYPKVGGVKKEKEKEKSPSEDPMVPPPGTIIKIQIFFYHRTSRDAIQTFNNKQIL